VADHAEKDEMRLCPTCRVPISVLATRCRHCGEEVGRPRKEEHKLTMKDLGGSEQTSYTISGNVMDALEAFREEQISSQDAQRRQREQMSGSWFGRKSQHAGEQTARRDDMPELDATSRELSGYADGGGEAPRRPSPRRNLGPTPQERAMQAGIVIVSLTVLYFGGTFGWNKYQDYLARKEAELHPAYVTKALDMLAAGKPSVDALKEAVEAVAHTDSPENRAALDKVRETVADDIKKLLDAPSYSAETLGQASMLATRATLADNDPRIVELDNSVKAELAAYSLILLSLDVKTQRAKFKIHDPSVGLEEQDAGVGDYVGKRFVVQSILQNQVRLIDTKRKAPNGQRSVIARPALPITGE
jgi:ribosomal protein L40E